MCRSIVDAAAATGTGPQADVNIRGRRRSEPGSRIFQIFGRTTGRADGHQINLESLVHHGLAAAASSRHSPTLSACHWNVWEVLSMTPYRRFTNYFWS
jgi:hypothetical protein